jgi:hypothetical protein
MRLLRMSLLCALLLALPVIAFAADKQPNPPAKEPGGTQTYNVSILCTKNGEVVTESQLDLLTGFTCVIENSHNGSKLPDGWVAIVIGGPATDVPADVPAGLAPLLKHVVSGDFQAWYYMPRSDEIEFTWTLASDADTSLVTPKDAQVRTTAQPKPHKLMITAGSLAGRVCVSQF